MSAYPAYRAYKQPAANWLEPIPAGWMSLAIGRLFRRLKRTGFPDAELLSVYRDHGVIPTSSRDDNFNKPSEDLNPYQLVRSGDLVMNKMKAWQGSVAMSECEGIVSPAYFVYEPRHQATKAFFPRYLHHLLRSPIYITQYLARSKGIRISQWDLDPEAFERIEALLPPLSEQTRIARFLDHETARIDALIEKQQQLIALLKEKRQAVISHAVTKGLNPNAPLRDSGVEWLGMVPAHWEVARLKQVTHGATSGPYGSSLTKAMYTRSGIRVYGQQQVIAAEFSLGDYYISEGKFSEMTRYEVFPGDVLVTVMGTIGRVAVVPEGAERGIINPRLVRYKANPHRILAKFLRMSVLGNMSQAKLKLMSQGSTMEGLNMQILGDLPVALPPLTEQEEILKRLETNAVKLESLVDNAESTVELLQERRTALISAAVTGKIDVRGWKPPNSNTEQNVA